jgi:farnesyl-diphosphate farnesyltransferase
MLYQAVGLISRLTGYIFYLLCRYQEVIKAITQKMGRGMASFAALATPEQPVAEVNTIADYDLYCHYVAGLVGEGLSGLFSASGKERDFIKDQLTLSNHMGLLLQKTNILRDYREDVDEGRGQRRSGASTGLTRWAI